MWMGRVEFLRTEYGTMYIFVVERYLIDRGMLKEVVLFPLELCNADA